MTDRELMQKALEALDNISELMRDPEDLMIADVDIVLEAATALRERLAQPEQDYKEALRVLSLALEEAPGRLTPKQRSVWEKSRDVLCSAGGWA